ncbi:TetR/AcrR family transcriptional regulator [Candidatus Phycosocius spiralis]|uniref:HTH tetR-type domain-containing protein n=1 Tax=Candidatus Phycosocius spiralis TaxID=2815099 RepID=A0ABQ4PYL9_9PROT|nr:TetR/AcrR family transcriptional regulator [Candidatus Phycosocius spiralis]GIU67788.1 hypothetical protein PsB1_1942 [Candidatus Phycosocius spiralis]
MHVLQQNQILEVASQLFFELGFFKTKISDIAARSETSTASIYKIYPSKDAVFWAVIERTVSQIRLRIKQVDPPSDPMTFLNDVARNYQELCETDLFQNLIRIALLQNQLPGIRQREVERSIRGIIADLCLPALYACGRMELINLKKVDAALGLLSSFIEYHTIWYNFLTGEKKERALVGKEISQEAVRITLLAYQPSPA